MSGPTADLTGRLSARRPEGPRGALLTIDCPTAAAAHACAGQFCVISVGEHTGYFAIPHPAGAAQLQFYVQAGGGCADALLALSVGAGLAISAPMGKGHGIDAALETGDALLFVATGSGYAGLRGALLQALDAGRAPTVVVGFQRAEHVIFQADLERVRAAGGAAHVTLSQPDADWTGPTGYVGPLLTALAPDLSAASLIACGQGAMQADLTERAAALGLREGRFLTNY
jgi:NAD(P)H-flavin reductase